MSDVSFSPYRDNVSLATEPGDYTTFYRFLFYDGPEHDPHMTIAVSISEATAMQLCRELLALMPGAAM
jgi:hypothetical protein